MSEFLFQLEPYGDGSSITLPVSPESYEVQYPQNSETVNVNAIGDVNLLGHRGLRSVTLESFFPDQEYGFCVSAPEMSPEEYIPKIAAWKNDNQKLYIKIGGSVNFLCTITDFSFSEKDATGDIYYSIELTEYRKLGSNRVVPSSKGGASTSGGKTYQCKHGDTLSKISKKYYGTSKHASTLYSKNKSAIESAFKRHKKNYAKQQAAEWNKKYPSQKRTWKYYYERRKPKNSTNGKYLYGQPKIVIPPIKKK
jgi:hypothetical protein